MPSSTVAQDAQQQPGRPTLSGGKALGPAGQITMITDQWFRGQLSTPGIRVELREVFRKRENGQLGVQYHVFVSGAPSGQTYTVMEWPVTQAKPTPSTEGVTLGKDGIVMCAGRTPDECGNSEKPDDPIEFTYLPAKGEPYRMGLVSADGRTKAFWAVVPDPVQGKDRGCSVEAIRLMPRWEIAMLRVRGFRPSEQVTMSTKSYGESHDARVTVDAEGGFTTAVVRFVTGKSAGRTDVKLLGASCSPSVSFEWGTP